MRPIRDHRMRHPRIPQKPFFEEQHFSLVRRLLPHLVDVARRLRFVELLRVDLAHVEIGHLLHNESVFQVASLEHLIKPPSQ